MNIEQTLKSMGAKIIGDMKRIIIDNHRMASRKLVNSLVCKINKTPDGKIISLDFYGESYGVFVDKGRDRTLRSTKGSKTLREALEEWLQKKRIPLKSPSGKVVRGRGKAKDKLIKGTAYVMARAIHKRGWKEPPSPHGAIHFTKPLDENIQKICDTVYWYYVEKANDAKNQLNHK